MKNPNILPPWADPTDTKLVIKLREHHAELQRKVTRNKNTKATLK